MVPSRALRSFLAVQVEVIASSNGRPRYACLGPVAMRMVVFRICACLLLLLSFSGKARAQSASPQELQSLFKQGAQEIHDGNAAAAEATFRRATILDPSFAPAQLDLGLAQLKQGKLLDAIASIKKIPAARSLVTGRTSFPGHSRIPKQPCGRRHRRSAARSSGKSKQYSGAYLAWHCRAKRRPS